MGKNFCLKCVVYFYKKYVIIYTWKFHHKLERRNFMKKAILFAIMAVAFCFVFSFSLLAASTDEFGSVEIINGIDLSKMSTDEKALVVLYDGTEYHTYPANYIVKSSSDLGVDFSKLNSATGKSYGVGSIIRIVIPTTVKKHTTAINGNQGGKNLVEVIYPQDTQVSELVWGALMNCSKLEGIEIPATVQHLGQDAFSNCGVLEYVTFAENSQLTKIDKGCFASCKKLTEVVLPNSVQSIGKGVFYNCTGLNKLVLGANTTVFDGELVGAYAYGDANPFLEIYMNGAFATGADSLSNTNLLGRGNDRDLGRYVIFFTGTKEQALSLVSKYSGDVNLKNVNIVAFDPSKTSGQDYLGMDAYRSDITVNTNRVLVYGYGLCDAFYGGEHAEGQVLNSCQFGCGRNCGKVELLENPQHNLNISESLGENGYFGSICIKESCTVCNTVTVDKEISSLFESLGYSACTYTKGLSITQGFKVNNSAIEAYKAYAPDFTFGVLATVNSEGEAYAPSLESENVISTEFAKLTNNYVDIKVKGIPADKSDALIVLCAYIKVGGKTLYLDNGVCGETVVGISYNEANN